MTETQIFDPLNPAAAHHIINQKNLAKTVGYVAMLLPIVLFVLGSLISCSFDSISHYFYGPVTGTVFIGASAAVSLVLFAYSGKSRHEKTMASLAGLSLLVLLLVPTRNAGCELSDFPVRVFADATITTTGADQFVTLGPFLSGTQTAGPVPLSEHFALFEGGWIIHLISAGIFVAILGYFCFFIFTRIGPEHLDPDGSGNLRPEKVARNIRYRQSGWVIVIALAILAVGVLAGFDDSDAWREINATFWLEAIAVMAFARSWLLKGRAFIYARFEDHLEIKAREICRT